LKLVFGMRSKKKTFYNYSLTVTNMKWILHMPTCIHININISKHMKYVILISWQAKMKYTPLSLVSYVVTLQKNITLGRRIAVIEWVVMKVLMSTKLNIGSQTPFSFGIT
jgi:hypothetical protein